MTEAAAKKTAAAHNYELRWDSYLEMWVLEKWDMSNVDWISPKGLQALTKKQFIVSYCK